MSCKNAFGQSTLIDDHFKAMTQHDVKVIAQTYADDAICYSPNWEGAKKGRAEMETVYKRYFSSTPDITYSIISTIYAGDNIIVEYTVNGILSNPEAGTPDYMKGKKYTLNYCAIFTVKADKIVKETNYFDQVAFLKQVGFFEPH
ncbi:MAG: nuclear transport factor 2 family protein [Mucilaginibacter sp.]|nr:nuclear transport factor 2 family protein [Mucilaginibacter sp.]